MADFKAASSAISAAKVGSTDVEKVYAGADLVWSPPSTSGDRYTVGGTLSSYNSSRFSIGSRTDGGSDADWWGPYSYGEVRKNSDSEIIYTLLRNGLSGGNPYGNTKLFLAAFALSNVTLTLNGTAVSATSVRFVGEGNNLSIVFVGSGYNTFWSNLSVGDSISLVLNYTAETAADWDDYDDGIFFVEEAIPYATQRVDQLAASTAYSAIGRQDGISSGYRHWNAAGDAYLASGLAPFIAVWNFSDWAVYKWNGTTGSGNRYVWWYGGGSSNVTNTSKVRHVVVYLTQDPGGRAGFRDYDGPTDWMVNENGITVYENFGASQGLSNYVYPEEVKASRDYDTPRRVKSTSTSALTLLKVDNTVNSGTLSTAPPYVAVWWERTGSTTVRDWFIASYSGSGGGYDFVRSKSGATAFHSATNMTNEFVIVNLSADPGTGISNWTDYDGEVTPWESQETAINFWASGNNWWALDSNTSWTRGGTLFANAQYIKLVSGRLIMRLTNGSFVTDGQDYIDDYGIPVLWVWINGNKYVFDELNQVTGTGDIILKGPAMTQSDFEENSSTGENAFGWADDVPVKIEFRPQWDTFYPRTALLAGQTSQGAGSVDVQYDDWSSAFNYSSSMVTASSGNHPVETFSRASLTQIGFGVTTSSYNTYQSGNSGIKWYAFKRGSKAWDKAGNIEYGTKNALKADCVYGTLDWNTFATDPIGCLISTRDPGPVYLWSDYDGPLYGWNSYAEEIYTDTGFNTSSTEASRIPLTEVAGTTGNVVFVAQGAGAVGYSAPRDRCPQVGYTNRSNIYSSTPASAFYHSHGSVVGSGGYSYASGWHAWDKTTNSTYQSGNGGIPFDIVRYSPDTVDGGWRGPIGTRSTLVTSTESGDKAKYWKPPFVDDGLQFAGIINAIGSTYNCRSDTGGSNKPAMFVGEKYARVFEDPIEDTKTPGYMFIFSANRILVQFTGTNAAANATAFDNARPSSTCTVRLRGGTSDNTSIGIGTEHTYTGTWAAFVGASRQVTLSNPSSGAPTWNNYTDYSDGSWTPMSLNFMIRIED